MKPIFRLAGVAALTFVLAAAAHSQQRPSGAGQRPSTAQQNNAAAMQQQMEERRAEAEARRLEAEAENRSAEMRAEHAPDEHAAEGMATAESRMNEDGVAATMQERRDEGKAIREDYRENREPGQEGAGRDADKDNVAEEQQEKAKKPWWKFWE